MSAPAMLARPGGVSIAYHHLPGRAPTVVFLPGFASDMGGTKALHLDAFCRARGQACLRFDYQGHGASSGRFEDGTIGTWAADARAVVESVTDGPVVLVGSSMGGWIMLLVALAIPARITALLGVAPAPDFTEDLIRDRLDDAERETLRRDGVVYVPSDYGGDPCAITQRFVDDGRAHLLLRGTIELRCPVRLVHGLADPDVPWQTSLRLAQSLAGGDVQITLVKDGGHRLSGPVELDLISARLAELLDAARAP